MRVVFGGGGGRTYEVIAEKQPINTPELCISSYNLFIYRTDMFRLFLSHHQGACYIVPYNKHSDDG
jgi:hypothetical protein